MNLEPIYDIILCNPPFNTDKIKGIYKLFFMKILKLLNKQTKFYFICPNMFVSNQIKINLDIKFDTNRNYIEFIKSNNQYVASFYYEKFGFIQLDSLDFSFNKTLYNKMLEMKIITEYDLLFDEKHFVINETYDIRFLRHIRDFKTTSISCILLRISI